MTLKLLTDAFSIWKISESYPGYHDFYLINLLMKVHCKFLTRFHTIPVEGIVCTSGEVCMHNGTCPESGQTPCDCSGTGFHGDFCEYEGTVYNVE